MSGSSKPPAPLLLRRAGVVGLLRRNFLAGLVVVAPIGITVWLIWTLTGWMDSWVLPMIPMRWRPEQYIGIPLRGVGVIFFLLFTVLIGWAARGWVGRTFLRTGEQIVARLPVVRSIYGALKQIAETVLTQDETRFDQACMIEFPRKGLWRVGFVAGPAKGELPRQIGSDLIAVFVPNTPNATTGFLVYTDPADVRMLKMSIEDAAKIVISAGLVYPTMPDPSSSSRRSTVS